MLKITASVKLLVLISDANSASATHVSTHAIDNRIYLEQIVRTSSVTLSWKKYLFLIERIRRKESLALHPFILVVQGQSCFPSTLLQVVSYNLYSHFSTSKCSSENIYSPVISTDRTNIVKTERKYSEREQDEPKNNAHLESEVILCLAEFSSKSLFRTSFNRLFTRNCAKTVIEIIIDTRLVLESDKCCQSRLVLFL